MTGHELRQLRIRVTLSMHTTVELNDSNNLQFPLDSVEHMSLNVSLIQPLLEGLMAASGVLGEQLRRARGIEVLTLRS